MRETIDFFSDLNTLILATAILGMLAWAAWAYISDRRHPTSALRRSFPLLARGRYSLEHMGVFLRQYMFQGDRAELPFNREQRKWCYRASDNDTRTIPFGSTHDPTTLGSFTFKPSLYPTLEEDSVLPVPKTIGDNTQHPYTVRKLIHISGMSYGSLSKPAVEALAQGAKMAGCWLNTGEGGITPYHLDSGADVVVQIGTGHYSMRREDGGIDFDKLIEIASHPNVKMFELKISQGAKPGKGGVLPGNKITDEIANLRGIPPGKDSYSPNRHIEAGSAESLLDLVAKIRRESGKPCGIKLCVGNEKELDDLLSKVKKDCGPDFITVDGAEGGTGAAPASLMDYVGLLLFDALPTVDKLLRKYGLREKVEIIASGKLVTPDRVAAALAHGADFCVSARGFMFALGCIQALHCNDNTCPTGITTHDPKLTKNLIVDYRAERVANYVKNLEWEVGVIAHSCGVQHPRELTTDHLYGGVYYGTEFNVSTS